MAIVTVMIAVMMMRVVVMSRCGDLEWPRASASVPFRDSRLL